MRFPYGYRPTLAEAIGAAHEAAGMTGLRYRVSPAGAAADGFVFQPVEWPRADLGHMGVRV